MKVITFDIFLSVSALAVGMMLLSILVKAV